MKNLLWVPLFLIFSPSLCWAGAKCAPPGAPILLSNEELAKRLDVGLEGVIHGAIPGRNLYVFTIRGAADEDGFPEREDMALTSYDPKVLQGLTSVTRNTVVRIHGNLLQNEAPIPHIDVTRVEMLRTFRPDPRAKVVPASESALQEAKTHRELVATVHAVGRGNPYLVIDYADHVIPVFIAGLKGKSELQCVINRLNRFDQIKLHYRPMSQVSSTQPLHLILDTEQASPIEILTSVKSLNGRKATLKGWLVQYPINPAIGTTQATYGVRTEDPRGTTRDVFLFSGDDEAYAKLHALLEKKWNATSWSQIVFSRNRYINHAIRVEATGTIAVVAPNQANPQLLTTLDAVKLK